MSLPARHLVDPPAHPSPVHLTVISAFPEEISDSLNWGARLQGFLMTLAHLHVLLGGAVAVGAWMVQRVAGLPVSLSPCLGVFLTFFSIYALDRVAAEPEVDAINHPERQRFSSRHARVLLGLAVAAYVIALVLGALEGLGRFLVMLLPLAGVLVYSFPFVPRPLARWLGFRRLKEILVIKNALVASIFASTITLAPIPAEGQVARGSLAVLWVFFFVRGFINTVVFDMRDEQGDRRHGIRTLPVALGPERTRRLLHGLNLALGIFLLLAPALGLAPPAFSLLAVGTPLATWYLNRTAQEGSMHFLCDVVVDGEVYVAGLALLVGMSVI
jgi:4-hydroxybenzoate polyprenyltransferase